MQATARIKYLMMSPRKLRRVVELIKGKSVEEALAILKYTTKAAALPLAKTIQSATANALSIEGTSHLKAEDLSISHIYIDEGPRAKRIRFRAMGRVYRYKHRFAHVTVVVAGEPREEVAKRRFLKRSDAADAAKPETGAATAETKAAPVKKEKTTAKKTAGKKSAAGKKAAAKKSGKGKAAVKKSKPSKPTAKKKSAGSHAAPKKKK
jgi:large subunit ribosomal protein L22